MSYTGIRPGDEGLNALRERWDSNWRLKGFEEAAIVNDFDKPDGVDSVGEQIHIRIIPAVTVRTTTDAPTELGAADLSYETEAILEVTATPSYDYVAIGLPNNLTARLGSPDTASLEAAYRKHALGALVAGAPEGLPGFSKDLLWYIGISHTAYVG